MNYITSKVVPNKPVGDTYYRKLQLIVPMSAPFKVGDKVAIKSASGYYDGVHTIGYRYDNASSSLGAIAALYFADVEFVEPDTGTIELYSQKSTTTTGTTPVTTTVTKPVNEADYSNIILSEMNHIKADPAFIKLIQDNYKAGPFGYTQTIATNAIKELKEAGVIPMNWQGEGIWGQGAYVKANYPYDEYTAISSVTTTPVIPNVDPNPGASTNTITPAVNVVDNTGTTTTGTGSQVVPLVNTPLTTASILQGEWYKQPVAQLVIGVLVIMLVFKLLKS